MEVSRYVHLTKVVLILTTILLSPIKGLADGRKAEKIDRIENLEMSKKKEPQAQEANVNRTQSRGTVRAGMSNEGRNPKKVTKRVSNEGRNNSQSKRLSDYIGYVVLGLSVILLVICSCLLFVVNRLSRGLSALKEELSARVNPQPEKGVVDVAKNKEKSTSEKGSLSAIEQRDREDLRKKNKYLVEKNEELEKEGREKDTKIRSLEEEIENLKSQLQAETAVERPQETDSSSSETNHDKVETPETTVYYIEGTPSTTEGIKLHTEKPNRSFFKVTVQGTSASLSVIEGNLDSVLSKNSGFVSIEEGYGGTGAKLISEGKGTIKYTGGEPTFTLTDKIKYKKV